MRASIPWILGLAVVSCTAPPAADESAPRAGGATRLEGSLEPLRRAFNDLEGSPRLLVVLSPACPRCLYGGWAATRPALREVHGDLEVLLVWMDVLPWDQSIRERVREFATVPGVRQFHDRRQLGGRLVADTLGWPGDAPAWDVYLLFDAGVRWEARLPSPAAWFHQQRHGPPERYRTGPALEQALADSLAALGSGG